MCEEVFEDGACGFVVVGLLFVEVLCDGVYKEVGVEVFDVFFDLLSLCLGVLG